MSTKEKEIKELKEHLKNLEKRNLGGEYHHSILKALISRKEQSLNKS